MDHAEENPSHIRGVVTAKTCDCCGHHEIGITTENGTYIPMKPGMVVEVLNGLSTEES